MQRPGVGRNDPCPCGSGQKFKKCCLAQGSGGKAFVPPRVAVFRPAPNNPAFAAQAAPPQHFGSPPPIGVLEDEPLLPDPSTAEVLPTEVALKYTYPEPFGVAEVTHILPAGRIYQLADGREIVNDDLEPGMQMVLRDGVIGTISEVVRYYEPPDPPLQVKPGCYFARVTGTIKHRGVETINVSWPESTVTCTPGHKFYSVTRGGYVTAAELQLGEILLGDDGQELPVTSVGERKLGLIDLYNFEVEHFHNYHVGEDPSVLVHNGATGEGGYINTPADKGPARKKQIPVENGYWSNSPAKGAPANGIPGESYWHSTDPVVNGHPDYKPIKFTNRYPDFSPFAKVTVQAELTGKPGSGDHKAAAKALARELIANPALAEQLGIPLEAYTRGKTVIKPNATGVLNWMKQQPNGGLTWHHSIDMKSMMMVPTDIHSIAHAGGADLLRQASGIRLNPARWR